MDNGLYLIGYSVKKDDPAECPYLKVASGENDTGLGIGNK